MFAGQAACGAIHAHDRQLGSVGDPIDKNRRGGGGASRKPGGADARCAERRAGRRRRHDEPVGLIQGWPWPQARRRR